MYQVFCWLFLSRDGFRLILMILQYWRWNYIRFYFSPSFMRYELLQVYSWFDIPAVQPTRRCYPLFHLCVANVGGFSCSQQVRSEHSPFSTTTECIQLLGTQAAAGRQAGWAGTVHHRLVQGGGGCLTPNIYCSSQTLLKTHA